MASATRKNDFQHVLDILPADGIKSNRDYDGGETGSGLLKDESNLFEAVKHAASNPVGDYPPLAQSVFAGDTVAIVLQQELSQPVVALKTVIDLLNETSIESADISVVVPPRLARTFGLQLPGEGVGSDEEESEEEVAHPLDSGFPQVNFVVHDRADDETHSYIAANEAALPMKVNRTIVDADVIIPLGCPVAGDVDKVKDCIYPQFSNEETWARFEKETDSPDQRRHEIEFANDQLGAFYGMQFVTAPGGDISAVVSGTRADCLDEARSASEQLWTLPVGESDQLVIGTIETSDGAQTWNDFMAAVFTASVASASDRPIVIWSNIRKQPTAAIRRACNRQFENGESAKLTRELSRLSGILEGRLVYLYSGLSENVTEELGLGYISGPQDIKRLVESNGSCLLVRDAHKSLVAS